MPCECHVLTYDQACDLRDAAGSEEPCHKVMRRAGYETEPFRAVYVKRCADCKRAESVEAIAAHAFFVELPGTATLEQPYRTFIFTGIKPEPVSDPAELQRRWDATCARLDAEPVSKADELPPRGGFEFL
jgi:hypothetical protein